MGKKLNKKGAKYASDEVCKACNLTIKGDVFNCFDCNKSIHASCTGLSRKTKLLYFVTNRTCRTGLMMDWIRPQCFDDEVSDLKPTKYPRHILKLIQGVTACVLRECQCCIFYFSSGYPQKCGKYLGVKKTSKVLPKYKVSRFSLVRIGIVWKCVPFNVQRWPLKKTSV